MFPTIYQKAIKHIREISLIENLIRLKYKENKMNIQGAASIIEASSNIQEFQSSWL